MNDLSPPLAGQLAAAPPFIKIYCLFISPLPAQHLLYSYILRQKNGRKGLDSWKKICYNKFVHADVVQWQNISFPS
jgi:hypothetical protein